MTTSDQVREALEALSKVLEREIASGMNWPKDHACAECVPGGEIVVPGFRCGRHAALAALSAATEGDAPPPEPKPDATGGEADICGAQCGEWTCQLRPGHTNRNHAGPSDDLSAIHEWPVWIQCTTDEALRAGRPHCLGGCRTDAEHERYSRSTPSPEAATRCQHHSVFCLGCESCARVQGAALRAATAELERVRADEAWWKRQRDDALAANERAKNGFAKERAALRAKLEEAERRSAGLQREHDLTARVATEQRARADDLAKRLEEAERRLERADLIANGDEYVRANAAQKKCDELRTALAAAERRIAEAVKRARDYLNGDAGLLAADIIALLTPAVTEVEG